jgi:hypothetical protein
MGVRKSERELFSTISTKSIQLLELENKSTHSFCVDIHSPMDSRSGPARAERGENYLSRKISRKKKLDNEKKRKTRASPRVSRPRETTRIKRRTNVNADFLPEREDCPGEAATQ